MALDRDFVSSRGFLGVVIILVFLLIYVFYPSDWWGGRDLPANLFAGAIDIVITLTGVDLILQASERRKHRPVQLAMYTDSRIVLNRFTSLWSDMIKVSSEYWPAVGDYLFDPKFVMQIEAHLNLSASLSDRVYHSWPDLISRRAEEVNRLIDKIFDRYSGTLNSDLFTSLSELQRSATLVGLRMTNHIYMMRLQDAPEIAPALSLVEGFDSIDRPVFDRLYAAVVRQGIGLEKMEGFYPVPTLTLQHSDMQNIIWPQLGLARR